MLVLLSAGYIPTGSFSPALSLFSSDPALAACLSPEHLSLRLWDATKLRSCIHVLFQLASQKSSSSISATQHSSSMRTAALHLVIRLAASSRTAYSGAEQWLPDAINTHKTKGHLWSLSPMLVALFSWAISSYLDALGSCPQRDMAHWTDAISRCMRDYSWFTRHNTKRFIRNPS